MDPKWYLKHQYNPLDKEPLPFESDVHEKYQIEHAAEMVNWVTPYMKALTQRYPKSEYIPTYLVSSV